jgi:glycosyltransferase involved in cell wall biosynthesis
MTAGPLRIAAFGFRSIPPQKGAAGADKFALELLPRLVAAGHSVIAYSRIYDDDGDEVPRDFRGVWVIPLKTVTTKGFDTLLHSAKAAYDIIRHNRADVVHIQNGGNSLFALALRLAGKKTFLSQDGLDWDRAKWSWYAKIYLRFMAYLTAVVHNEVIFDNIFARDHFENKYHRRYRFVPFGADVAYDPDSESVLAELGLAAGDYFLFVGRFIPDKGLHYLIPAFSRLETTKKLVLVGGSPNPSNYETQILSCTDPRIIFPGFVYGGAVHALMKNCYAYIQPSDVEGLSPVILESSFLGAPIICSDIPQNQYGLGEAGIYFSRGNIDDLHEKLLAALDRPDALREIAHAQQSRVASTFSWDSVVADHIAIFHAS